MTGCRWCTGSATPTGCASPSPRCARRSQAAPVVTHTPFLTARQLWLTPIRPCSSTSTTRSAAAPRHRSLSRPRVAGDGASTSRTSEAYQASGDARPGAPVVTTPARPILAPVARSGGRHGSRAGNNPQIDVRRPEAMSSSRDLANRVLTNGVAGAGTGHHQRTHAARILLLRRHSATPTDTGQHRRRGSSSPTPSKRSPELRRAQQPVRLTGRECRPAELLIRAGPRPVSIAARSA